MTDVRPVNQAVLQTLGTSRALPFLSGIQALSGMMGGGCGLTAALQPRNDTRQRQAPATRAPEPAPSRRSRRRNRRSQRRNRRSRRHSRRSRRHNRRNRIRERNRVTTSTSHTTPMGRADHTIDTGTIMTKVATKPTTLVTRTINPGTIMTRVATRPTTPVTRTAIGIAAEAVVAKASLCRARFLGKRLIAEMIRPARNPAIEFHKSGGHRYELVPDGTDDPARLLG